MLLGASPGSFIICTFHEKNSVKIRRLCGGSRGGVIGKQMWREPGLQSRPAVPGMDLFSHTGFETVMIMIMMLINNFLCSHLETAKCLPWFFFFFFLMFWVPSGALIIQEIIPEFYQTYILNQASLQARRCFKNAPLSGITGSYIVHSKE